MNDFAEKLSGDFLDILRDIDREWDITNGETELCRRIAAKFKSDARNVLPMSCNHDSPYPNQEDGSCRYDLCLGCQTGETIYAEVKCHWPTYWLKSKGNLSTYRKHLSGTSPKANSSMKDVQKLKRLTPASATHVALLIIGSYSAPPDPHSYVQLPDDFDAFEKASGVGRLPWSRARISDLNNPHAPWSLYRRDIRLYVAERKLAAD